MESGFQIPPESATASPAPFFSVATACCNVAPFLRECLDSLLAQSFADWECIVWAEESEDGTEAILREYAARDPRIRVHGGPRTGSVSVSRNKGIELSRGEYIVFLDGDDFLAPGCLARLHDAIAARPGADLYPCAVRVRDDRAEWVARHGMSLPPDAPKAFDNRVGRDGELRDNYPLDAPAELTGPEATILSNRHKNDTPQPQLQITVFRRAFLLENGLRCIPGLRRQDSEFSPRALYLARRVVPLHEPYYVYRLQPMSVSSSERDSATFLGDWAVIFRSLFAFHARVSRDSAFDRRVADGWRNLWLTRFLGFWFYPSRIRGIPRRRRTETLETLFRDGFDGLHSLAGGASLPKRIACRWAEWFVRHPVLRPAAEWFFALFFSLAEGRSGGRTGPGAGSGKA